MAGTEFRDKARDLRKNIDELRRMASELEMWGHVQAQGIDIAQVKAFYWERFCSSSLPRENRVNAYKKTHYNRVKLKDGSTVTLDPLVKRPPEETTATEEKVIWLKDLTHPPRKVRPAPSSKPITLP